MYKQYSSEKKKLLINEVLKEKRSIASIAEENGISVSTLHRWVNEAKSILEHKEKGLTLYQLESEIRILEKERDTLMSAFAIYAKNFKGQ